jgi:hypothetical protein
MTRECRLCPKSKKQKAKSKKQKAKSKKQKAVTYSLHFVKPLAEDFSEGAA